jgi:hypothetical protein
VCYENIFPYLFIIYLSSSDCTESKTEDKYKMGDTPNLNVLFVNDAAVGSTGADRSDNTADSAFL